MGGGELTIVRTRELGVDVLVVEGEVDMQTAPRLRMALDEQLATGAPFILDLCGVSFLDSTGVAVLARAARGMRTPLALACAEASAVHRVLEITGLAGRLALHPTRAAALEAAA